MNPIATNTAQTDAKGKVLGITVGDPAGIGPEIALRCASLLQGDDRCRIILYGPKLVLKRVSAELEIEITGELRDIGHVDMASLVPGIPNAETGLASYQAVDLAIRDAISGKIDAMVTGPIQKEAWHAAGISFPGHTELLADRTGIKDFCMMLTSPSISCVLATIHIPLADISSQLSIEGIDRAIRLASQTLSPRLGHSARITVCGLNPHAGENGQFSHGEEKNIIQPAIDLARNNGFNVTGPVPPDTAFTPSMRSRTDAYVCMYHDQGLIPLKALAFDDAVNVTLGLPIIRTSVDHGTALDLAWQGTAKHQSMLAAIELAIESCEVKS